MHVTVMGAGYVGGTTAVVLAACGHAVTCLDRDRRLLEVWQSGRDPLDQPGLAALLGEVSVRFSDDPGDLALADVIVVAVGTPAGSWGRPDLSQIDAAAAQIAGLAREGAVVLIRSTVPVGTCDRLQHGALRRQHVVSNPEFLREGCALDDALHPHRIVAGGPPQTRPVVERLYRDILDGFPDTPRRVPVPLLWMSARSAELAKYAANGFLATKLSYVNEIANLAQAVGADASAVLGSMGFDPRIGPDHLRPGLGWGGACFPKDTRALNAMADGAGYDFVVLRAAIEQNGRQLNRFAALIEVALQKGSTIALLGLAFKAGTADTRESPAVALATRLLRVGFSINSYDPAVRELPGEPDLVVCATAREACAEADAIVLATEWPEFAQLDLAMLRQVTRGNLLFDGRNLITPRAALEAGFRYCGLGDAAD
jgi:nucleotide sugar dehydrogenase